jgi:hypothetical protein
MRLGEGGEIIVVEGTTPHEMTTADRRDLLVLVAKVWILSGILPAAWT